MLPLTTRQGRLLNTFRRTWEVTWIVFMVCRWAERFFMGYVEELGVGRRTLLKYGPAYFDGRDVAIKEDDVFRITIPYKPTILLVGTINGTIKLVNDAIIENAGASGPKLSELTGVSLRTLKRHVAELVEKRMVEYRGSKKTGGYYPVET